MTNHDVEPPPESGHHLSLRFLSGRCKGSEYVLGDGEEVVVGRAADVDLMLMEGIISRAHARFTVFDGVLTVEDLKSTNGTFVNGDRIRRRRLEQGDRVLIGTSILKVVWSDAPLGTVPPRPDQEDWADTPTAATADGRKMTGRLDEVAVPDLMEMFLSSDLSGVLVLRQGDAEGRITMRSGQIEQVSVSTLAEAPADKCLQRLMGWTQGTFAIRPYRPPEAGKLDLSIRHALVDGLFKLDELTMLQSKLPGLDDRVEVARPLGPPLRDLTDSELDLLQVAHNSSSLQQIFDTTPETDWAAAQRLLRLIDGGYLRLV